MQNSLLSIRVLFIVLCLSLNSKAQTLILNEVSNGPSGNQEYMELAVVSNSVTYNCNGGALPTLDIRGWIFDDNSGYHGTSGIASGALRFSYDAMWANVPLGTIILIYNDADPNPAIPADDVSLTDGNCKLIIPVSSNLIEKNTTTPGAVSCSYPLGGWTAGGDWTFDVLANGGDCARIVNLAGCEVFSVCYGSDNLNNLIYFAGNGGQTVYYFNSGNPTLQSNWSAGTASVSATAETPGAANNTANANYINQFNNGCALVSPLSIATTSLINANCICDGLAQVTTSGGLGTYSYQWYDSNFNTMPNTTTSNNALCAGNYSVIVTTNLGNCTDTVAFTIGSNPSTIADFSILPSSPVTVGTTVNLTNTSTNAISYQWTACNGAAFSSTNVSLPLLNVGSCCIDLIATNGSCINTVTKCITVVETINEATMLVPNVFTPNGDKANDVFEIKFTSVKNVSLSIYNRWGTLVHQATNTLPNSMSWDGATTSGTKANSGTYFYVIEYTDLSDASKQQKGFLSLFKD